MTQVRGPFGTRPGLYDFVRAAQEDDTVPLRLNLGAAVADEQPQRPHITKIETSDGRTYRTSTWAGVLTCFMLCVTVIAVAYLVTR